MTVRFNNVYLNETSLVAGHLENEGPMHQYFDKTYDDNYMIDGSVEECEVRLQKDSISILLEKTKLKQEMIDLVVGGDLLNQICATSFALDEYKIPFIGLFGACATSMESIIVGSTFIDCGKAQKVIGITSSHNLAAEKQFRYPIEYGGPKPMTATFTATGAGAVLLSQEKSKVKVTSGTIGRIIDMDQNDSNNMGAAMVPAAADTINRHLKDMKRTVNDYDLILTGDLGKFGKEILIEYMKKEYNISLDKNYNDCGVMLYDFDKQKEITAGGSGCACSVLVNYGYVFNKLKKGELKKVLLVTTGALFSPTFSYQKQNILGIAHAVSLEVE